MTLKKFTIPKDELRPGDFPIAFSKDGYAIIYREIPEFGTSAELNATRTELAKAKATLTAVNEVAHRYFYQARRLKELGANRLADRAVIHAERILAALRGEGLQDWPLPTEDDDRAPNEARAWNAWLYLALDSKLDDGTPLLKAVLEQNPDLAARLDAVINKETK